MKRYQVYNAYTDGACTKKGEGGIGVFMYCGSVVNAVTTLKHANTTNNQMELGGAILALRHFELLVTETNQSSTIIIHTDSQYVQKGLTEWIFSWKKKNWKNSAGKPVLNQELWKLLDELQSRLIKLGHQVILKWVRGHDGNLGNEIADKLAGNTKFDIEDFCEVSIIEKIKKLIDEEQDEGFNKLFLDESEVSFLYNTDKDATVEETLSELVYTFS